MVNVFLCEIPPLRMIGTITPAFCGEMIHYSSTSLLQRQGLIALRDGMSERFFDTLFTNSIQCYIMALEGNLATCGYEKIRQNFLRDTRCAGLLSAGQGVHGKHEAVWSGILCVYCFHHTHLLTAGSLFGFLLSAA